MSSTQKHGTAFADLEARAGLTHASAVDVDTILRTLLSRLDAEQARAFLRKMAELDAEALQRH